MEKLVIIGSGPAGLTAGIYAARANLSPVVIEGDTPGGQLLWTTEVENFPGFETGVLGPELMQKMQKQATRFGSKLIGESVISVDFSQKPFKITTNKQTFEAESVIIASGARSRMLGLPKDKEYLGKGLHTCATCDGAFYRGKIVAVIGGGDSAMEDANFLSKFAEKVIIIHRRDALSASQIMQARAKNNPKIEFAYTSEVIEYSGSNGRIGELKLLNSQTKETSILKVDGIFMAIGHIPNTEPFVGQIKLGKNGYIEPINWVYTDVPGIFVAGDVADWRYRQAVTAAGFGCMAALEVEKYLAGKE
ncbi:MAG: thioredoxin-disulfide reductase [Candidatus Komeilibacteria bacterium]|nr:thioredoxin-disulfide reductase [Candidatus Komeilibacteria bacterium]